ncbi:MAG: RHS repeat protein, partial [Burkholderiales bacterium]|nr:RHS repeat protein [Burkholderiales bacterium]
MKMNHSEYTMHHKTPRVVVLNQRGLTVREVSYQRHPSAPTETDERITCHQYDAGGFLRQSIDPRLAELQQTDKTVKPNFSQRVSLRGDMLRTESVDGGSTVSLSDIAGRFVLVMTGIETDARMIRTWQYEEGMSGRPLSVTEQIGSAGASVMERFVWSGNTEVDKAYNLAGTCVRYYDPAGLSQTESIGLTGASLSLTRRLLPDGAPVHWKGEEESGWKAQLDAEGFTTQYSTDATGVPLTSSDAMGNVQRMVYGRAGLLKESWLKLTGKTEQVIVASVTYAAAG